MGEYRRPHYNLMLSRLSERRKCIFVLAGPRQVGKSTVMAQIAETIDKVVFQFNADSVNEEDRIGFDVLGSLFEAEWIFSICKKLFL